MEDKNRTLLEISPAPEVQEPPEGLRFRFWETATRRGFQAGLLMGFYLILVQLLPVEDGKTLRFLKYLFLAGILAVTLSRAKSFFPPVTFFKKGILLGIVTTFFSAVTLLFVNFGSYALIPDFSLEKFQLIADDLASFFVINSALFFEVLVFGLILTFICLQYLKYRPVKS
jgi:hypothetical protein